MAFRRTSAGDGGWNKVVGGSSVFALSALAVDKEIVGKDKEGELIWVVGGLGAAAAANRAAVADWVSALVLGMVEKNWTSRFGFDVDDLRGISLFS